MHNKRAFAVITIIFALMSLICSGGIACAESGEEAFFSFEPDLPAFQPGKYIEGSGVAVSAGAAVVMDAGTGQLLYAKNPFQQRPIASTTKIMTALLAIECGDLGEMVTVSELAAGVEGSSVYLRAGEKLSLEELIYGALMRSGNDACVAIAEHIAGREGIFVGWMNYKASLLGLKNTHFSNTNGLPDKGHFSSAYDLAVITRFALKNPDFGRIVSTKSHIIGGPQGQRRLSNTNQMLWKYQGADGVKTGTTNAAGRCLVSSASRDGRRLIAVVLNSHNRYADSMRLLDYGFSNYKHQIVVRSGEVLAAAGVTGGIKSEVRVGCPEDVVVAVPVKGNGAVEKVVIMDREISAPVKPGMVAGKLLVLVEGDAVAETELITREYIGKMPFYRLMYKKTRDKAAIFIDNL